MVQVSSFQLGEKTAAGGRALPWSSPLSDPSRLDATRHVVELSQQFVVILDAPAPSKGLFLRSHGAYAVKDSVVALPGRLDESMHGPDPTIQQPRPSKDSTIDNAIGTL